MKIVIQRVQNAAVFVHEKKEAAIKKGLLLLVGIDETDSEKTVYRAVKKVLNLRIFEDEEGKMNKSVRKIGGEILAVPNFTLTANTEKGNRPSFTNAASPVKAKKLYKMMIEQFGNDTNITVETGKFGAHMKVKLLNDGPATFIIEKKR